MSSSKKKRRKLSPGAVIERHRQPVIVEPHRHLTYTEDKTSTDFFTTTRVAHPIPPSQAPSSDLPNLTLPYTVEHFPSEAESFVTYSFTAPNLDNNPDLPRPDGSDWNNVEIGSRNVCAIYTLHSLAHP